MEEELAPLERGTVFETAVTTDGTSVPQCLLTQGQSYRGEIKYLILLADASNTGTVYIGSEGMTNIGLTKGVSIPFYNINPGNIFFTGKGTSGQILHAISGGIV